MMTISLITTPAAGGLDGQKKYRRNLFQKKENLQCYEKFSSFLSVEEGPRVNISSNKKGDNMKATFKRQRHPKDVLKGASILHIFLY